MSGVNSAASRTFSSSWAMVSHPMITVLTGWAGQLSLGQMVEDVKLAVEGRCPVHFYGRTGGGVPTSLEIIRKIVEIVPDNRAANTLLQLAEVK